MESQQQRRRKQEKPRHLNSQDEDDAIGDDRNGNFSTATEGYDLLCKYCQALMTTRSELNDHVTSFHQTPRPPWEVPQAPSRPPVINLMKKKFSFVQPSVESCASEEEHSKEEATEEGSEPKKMRMAGDRREDSDEDSEDDSHNPSGEGKSFFKNSSVNVHQLNLLLLQLQQHQIIHWQVLDAVRKKVIEDRIPPDSEVFNELTSLLLRHQKEIAHISSTYQLTVGFLNRGNPCKPPQDHHYFQSVYSTMATKHQPEDLRNGTISKTQASEAEQVSDSREQVLVDSPSRDILRNRSDFDEDDDDEDDEDASEASCKCSMCGCSFATKESLKIHFQQHLEHNVQSNINSSSEGHVIKTKEENDGNEDSAKRGSHDQRDTSEDKEKRQEDILNDRLPQVQHHYNEGSKDCTVSDVSRSCAQPASSSKREILYDRTSVDATPFGASKGNDFKSPLVALSSMSSALNFNKTPMSLMFPGEGSLQAQSYQSFRFSAPSNLMKSTIIPSNDDPLEQFMEIQMTENTKMEELIKEGESKVTDPNECAICHRVLSCRSALQMHYRTHTGERPYKCKLCSRTFTTKGNLKTHMSVHRGKPLQRQLHKCPICSREFSNPLVLQQHFRSHNSDPQKAFSSMFSGVIPGMFMPPINPFFSYPINPNPYFNPLFSSQFAVKNLTNITKVFQEQRTSPSKYAGTTCNRPSFNYVTRDRSASNETQEGDRRHEETHDEAAESSKPGNGKFEDISDKSSDESDGQQGDQKEETLRSSFNSVLKSEEGHLPNESKLPYKSPLVALADRVNALNQQYAFKEGQRQLREVPMQVDVGRTMPDDFNKSLILRPPSNLTSPTSFFSNSFFLKASESKSGHGDPQANSVGGGGVGVKASAACPICGKMFSCKSAVDIHMRSHTKERPFRCEYCDRAFTTKGNLKQHVGTNHHVIARVSEQTNQQPGMRTNNWMSDSSSSKSASPFNSSSAVVSGSMTSSPKVKQESSGVEHQNDQRPKEQCHPPSEPSKQNQNGARYFCTICEKPFSSTSALQIHSRTHTGDRPFVCPTCNKAFTTKGNLKVHMGTHAWNKVPSRRGRRMSVEPLGPQFNSPLGKDQVMNPSILASLHQKMSCADRFPYSLMGLAAPNLFQPKIADHPLSQGFHGKFNLMASLQGQSMCYPAYAGSFGSTKSPTAKSIMPQEVTVKTERLDNETELDLSIKKPSPPVSATPSKPLMILREGADWSNDVKPHHLALNCR